MYLLETFHDGDLITQAVFLALPSAIEYVDQHKLHSSSSRRTLLFRLREQSDGVYMIRSLTLSSKLMRVKLLDFGAYAAINTESAFHHAISKLS